MSSATIFHVIKEQLLHGRQKENEKGLIGALGPGFSSELLLFSWEKGLLNVLAVYHVACGPADCGDDRGPAQ